ncbi:MAG: ComEC/Rec2 family competence protein [Saprospiraceae bacterium]|nr:ComEC/Rec2 family competence protein [Pyrinomonadaceae bacterium]
MESNIPVSKSTLYPMLWLAACFAGGIVIAEFLEFDWRAAAGLGFVFAIAAALAANRKASFALLFASFVAAGAVSFQIEKNGVADNRLRRIYDEGRIESGEPVEIEGILAGKPELTFDGYILELDAEKLTRNGVEQTVSGRLRLYAPAQAEESQAEYISLDLRYGSRIRAACNPEREERFLNPGGLPRKQSLDQQGIDAAATVKSPLLIEKLRDEAVFTPLAAVYDQRAFLIEQFRDKFSFSAAGILIASLLGDKYFLDKQTADIFREGGTFHILVISGLHITFIGGLTLLFVGFFTKRKAWQFAVAVSFLWAYTLAVGADVPVVRASVMFTVLLFSQVIYRKSTLLNALGFCALILLVWRPSELFNPSFQLTFISVAAIVGMAFPLIERLRAIGNWSPTAETPFPPNVSNWLRRLCETLYWRESVWKIEGGRQIWSASLFKSPYLKWPDNLRGVLVFGFEGILVSLVVQLWLVPLLVVYFHRVSVASVFLNLWVGVFIALESFSAVAAVLLSHVSDLLAMPLVSLTEIFNSLLLSVPAFFVYMEWAGFRVPVYSGPMKAVYLVYLLPVIALAVAAHCWDPFALKVESGSRKFRRLAIHAAGAAGLVFLAVILFHPFSAPAANGKLQVDFLDVGQGDAAFITFPNGQTMLIDGGGRMNFGRGKGDDGNVFEPDIPRIGEAVVSEFLWEKGYSKIDLILATHADTDHMQGLTDVAKNFEVSKAYFSGTRVEDPDFTELNAVLTGKNIDVEIVGKGDVLEIGGVRIEVLHPDREDKPGVSENNTSLVLRIVFGENEFLFTGDIEHEAELNLLAYRADLRSDVVKVPHHGSRTSSTSGLVSTVNAGIAIVSVGRVSMFGHPHREIVERWKNSGATVMTTGEKGTISVISDGKMLGISTFIP